jgi:predicted GH43/DUF377 family glycosyl hydrolase
MNWIKKGVIFKPDGSDANMHSHAAIPFAVRHKDFIRVYFSSRNSNGKSLPFFVDVDNNDPQKILNVSRKPLMELGKLGSFDDSGIMPSSFVDHEGLKFMYYIGWNPQVTVSYRLSIGLAISYDDGNSFKRYAEGPVCDRSINEPYFNTAPFVIKEGSRWRMWYISCTQWDLVHNYPEPRYHIKYAESNDGVHWRKEGVVCVDYDDFAEALGRPSVYFENGIYKMYFSYRRITDYRTDRNCSYRLGYAESADGIKWEKKNDKVGISLSGNESEWDHIMMEYCHVLTGGPKKLMFYNGNGFGYTGFGYAVGNE